MRHRTLLLIWLPLALLGICPTVAYANAGTPLMWAGTFHLLFGNAMIGIAEGLLLVWLFRPKRSGTLLIMIAANYFSAWVGGLWLTAKIVEAKNLDLYSAWRGLWELVALTYLLTLLLEWPFVAFCLRKTEGWFRKSLWGTLVVQSASYLVLFGGYWMLSDLQLFTDLNVVPPTAMSLPGDVVVYYVEEPTADVYALDLGRAEPRKIAERTACSTWNRLLLRPSQAVLGHWDLVIDGLGQESSDSDPLVCADLVGLAADPPSAQSRFGGKVPRFHDDASGWEFWFESMYVGLSGTKTEGGERLNVMLETPFLRWPVHSPTQLPNGQVVFQLGRNQICVVDPNTRQIALVAKGRWPVVLRKGSPGDEPSTPEGTPPKNGRADPE